MDFSKYKNRFIDYANSQGMGFTKGKDTNCFLPEHGTIKKKTMSVYDEHCYCHKCAKSLDIYELAGFINNTSDKAEQYKIVSEYCDGTKYTPPKKELEFSICKKTEKKVTDFMRQQAKDNYDKVLSFAQYRGYGEEFAGRLGWWPGKDEALNSLSLKDLEKTGLSNFYSAGVVFKLPVGYKIMFVNKDGKTEKYASKGSKPFGYQKQFDGEKIVIVEAEISALAMCLNGVYTISSGGASATSEKHVSFLSKYKEVIFCLDADNAGSKFAEKCSDKIISGGYKGIVKIAKLKREGFDPDDYIKNGYFEELKQIIENAEVYEKIIDFEEEEKEEKLPFKFLGCTDKAHYFLDRQKMIAKIAKGKATAVQLLEIAPLNFWKRIKMNRQGNPDWIEIIESVIDASNKKGPYKKSSIRGFGFWKDNGEIIFSTGEYLFCKLGKIYISDYESKNTYIRRSDIGFYEEKNKQHKEDFDFINWSIKNLPFLTEQDGKFLYGWIIASLFLSVISWRPVAYMKGPSSVGKSWIMNNVVRIILGDLCVKPNKKSTYTGIMQAPGYDSMMITVDELEQSSNKKLQELVVNLITLARDTTTESNESRYVGTADQEGISSEFKSMFMFSSIVESAESDQDLNRITSINLYPKINQKWSEVEAEINYKVDENFSKRIINNAIFYRESIVENIRLFKRVAGKKADKQRNGDQIGTLVAGWYHLENPGKIATEEEIDKYLDDYDFSEQNERNKGQSFKSALSNILTFKIRYEEEAYKTEYGETVSYIKMRERTVFNILHHLYILSEIEGEDITRNDMNKALMSVGLRYGTKQNPGTLVIAANHGKVSKMFPDDFPYIHNYADYFKNQVEFICKEKAVRFSGTVHPAIILKVDLSEDEIEDKNKDIPF